MRGMSRTTGAVNEGNAHIVQSIRDLLTTSVGDRTELRRYGSNLPQQVDRPVNELFDVEIHAAVAEALELWEPRFKLTGVWIDNRTAEGRVTIGLEGVVVNEGNVVRIEGVSLT